MSGKESQPTEKSAPLSFFDNRMKLLGVTPENNRFAFYNPEAEAPAPKLQEGPIFQEDRETGDIIINYYTIDGHRIVYYTDSKTPGVGQRTYQVRRLAQPTGDAKYKMPAGQGTHPWFHPALVQAYKQGDKIETLYITEGVFKGWMGTENGIPTVGLSSITHYANAEKTLHRDIVRLMEACEVENVVVLWDGDCLNVSANDIQRREEATRRPYGFFNAAKALRKLILQATSTRKEPTRIYFMHQVPDYWDERPKGLDDVLILGKAKNRLPDVVTAFKTLHDNHSGMLYVLEITHSTDLMYRHFNLHDVDAFYRAHAMVIGQKEFYFNRDMYHCPEGSESVQMLQPSWARNIYWVGDEFFEEMRKPSANQNFDKLTMEPRQRATLAARFGKGFMRHLNYFHGFVNVPSHFSYERIVEREGKSFLNQYNPFPHIPEAGSWDNILGFLKHIFGEHTILHPKTKQAYKGYELGLDYLQILLTEPLQQLPILVLYSAENQTGKSTFGELCYKLFGDNVVFIGNADLQSDFNEVYANRLLAICEETLLERRRDAERIKNMSTATRIMVNPKGQRQYSIDFFTKFQFYSNNKRMVYVTRHDDRYWILEIPVVPRDKRDPKLKDRMWAELPAFAHYLQHRTLATDREARMHFNPDLLVTQMLHETIKLNEPSDAANMRAALKEWFIDLGPEVKEIRMPLSNIRDKFFQKGTSQRWIQEMLTDYLRVELLRHGSGETIHARGEYRELEMVINANGQADVAWKTTKWRGRPYIFRREDFLDESVLSDEEIEQQEDHIKAVAADADDLPF